MREADARSFLAQVHELMPTWFEDHLEARDVPWSQLQEAEMRKIARWLSVSTPRRFAECHYRNHYHQGGGLWRLWPNQIEAAKAYLFNVYLECGHGTGKTRTLEMLLGYAVFHGAYVLFVANSETARTEVFDDFLQIVRQSRFLQRHFPLSGGDKCFRRGNDMSIRGRRGNVARFKLVGPDGNQVQGIHVSGPNEDEPGYILCDEVDQYVHKGWSAVKTRAERNCRLFAATVPYKGIDSPFGDMYKRATPLDELIDLYESADSDAEQRRLQRVVFGKLKWARPDVVPHWDESMEQSAIETHGPKEGDMYRTYVLGERVSSSGAAFPWATLRTCFKNELSREYRRIKVIFGSKNDVAVEVFRSVWQKSHAPGDEMFDADSYDFHLVSTYRKEVALGDFDLAKFCARHLPRRSIDLYGADFGVTQDPTIIAAWRYVNSRGKRGVALVALIELKYAGIAKQRSLLKDLVVGRCGPKPKDGLAMEATAGSDGANLYRDLVNEDRVRADRLHPWAWNRRGAIPPADAKRKAKAQPKPKAGEQEVQRDPKAEGTYRILELAEHGVFHLPPDPEIKTEFGNHEKDQVVDDHTVEATRVGVLTAAGWKIPKEWRAPATRQRARGRR